MSVWPVLCLNGKIAAVWALHEDDSIEHIHFSAQPNTDENVLLYRLVSRPGDEDYERLLRKFEPRKERMT